jgi:small-conductance mechanosensitive channel
LSLIWTIARFHIMHEKKSAGKPETAPLNRAIFSEFYCCDFVLSPCLISCMHWTSILLCIFLFIISLGNMAISVLILIAFQSKILAHLSFAIPIVFLLIPLIESILSFISPSYLMQMKELRKKAAETNHSTYDAPSLLAEENNRANLFRSMHLLSTLLLILVFIYGLIAVTFVYYRKQFLVSFNQDLVTSFNRYTGDLDLKKVRVSFKVHLN